MKTQTFSQLRGTVRILRRTQLISSCGLIFVSSTFLPDYFVSMDIVHLKDTRIDCSANVIVGVENDASRETDCDARPFNYRK